MSEPLIYPHKEALDGQRLQDMLAGPPLQRARAIVAAARTGLLDAQVMLGQILLQGDGIQRAPELAVIWFRITAARGHPMAHNMLGRCFEHGWGLPADATRAAAHYRIAADRGLDWGLYNLANLYATGRGVPRDAEQAFQLYRQAAQLGHAKSMNLLGRCYEDGTGVTADPAEAFVWYQRSAEAGDFRGQYSLAAVLAGLGRVDEALAWLHKALAGGNLNFLRVARAALHDAPHPALRALARDFHRRAAELGDESDRAAYRALEQMPA